MRSARDLVGFVSKITSRHPTWLLLNQQLFRRSWRQRRWCEQPVWLAWRKRRLHVMTVRLELAVPDRRPRPDQCADPFYKCLPGGANWWWCDGPRKSSTDHFQMSAYDKAAVAWTAANSQIFAYFRFDWIRWPTKNKKRLAFVGTSIGTRIRWKNIFESMVTRPNLPIIIDAMADFEGRKGNISPLKREKILSIALNYHIFERTSEIKREEIINYKKFQISPSKMVLWIRPWIDVVKKGGGK